MWPSIGHQFELSDHYDPAPLHVMWSYQDQDKEALLPQVPFMFRPEDVHQIRLTVQL